MLNLLTTISISIFLGFRIFIPVLLLVQINRFRPQRLSWPALIGSVNTTYLLGGILQLGLIGVELFTSWFPGNHYISFDFTSTGVSLGMSLGIYILNYIALPQIMWIKRIRKSLISSAIVLVVGLLCSLILYLSAGDKQNTGIDVIDYLVRTSQFLGIVVVFYLIKKK